MRLILQLCVLLTVLLGVENHAWAKVAVPENIAVRGFAEGGAFGNEVDEPPALMSAGEAAAWGYDVASDVRDGPNLYAYVKQNPWSSFDAHGLSKDRVDPDGFEWSSDKHHVVPRAVARDAGWDKEAKNIFDKAKIDTPNGHNFSRHNKYNDEIAAEMAHFLKEKGLDSVSSAKNQKELAEEFVQRIMKTDNSFVKCFNEAVPKGVAAVQQWYDTTGQHLTLRSTGRAAIQGGSKISGMIGKLSAKGKVIAVGVPIVGTLFGAGMAYAGGARDSELAAEIVADSTFIGGMALEASHLRDVAAFQKAAIQFNQDPNWFFNTDTSNSTSNSLGGHFNALKSANQQGLSGLTSDEPTGGLLPP